MPEDIDVLALENQVCFALAVASRSVIGLYRPVLEPLGLTHPQYLVMLALWQQDPRSVTELGAALQLEPATLSPLLKRLEASGLIDRRRSSTDERRLDVTLTEAGRALRSRAESIPQTMIERLGMPVAELQTLQASLTAISAAASRSDS
ncbi:DNA-binding transcriptional regulator, MarR family [Agreia bicolorata]|uniref:DNA-binding transcriptional regulator, MarR family n=1 Tax=Agreia bicolorata TaxID=110935 RepID=A0A1T4XBV8_9MICO|nr:MarR family transcriptional regulator [Agreia bicolorata]KJC65542.1 MarR family transcriptional regulator [Agreia bicolorata]SKA86655.1 DNA-binding transcriptional regulator, MarR family [Agreia bicolorata]